MKNSLVFLRKVVSSLFVIAVSLATIINVACQFSSISTFVEHFGFASNEELNDFSENKSEPLQVYALIQLKSETNNIDSDDFSMKEEELLLKRKSISNYYEGANEKVAKSLGLDKTKCVISLYSPHIEITFKDYSTYCKNKNKLLTRLQKNKSIDRVDVGFICKDEAIINPNTFSTNYDLSDAFNDIGVSNPLYDGSGVKVGTIEPGTPDNTVNLNPNLFTSLSDNYHTEHCTIVTSIIGGNTGIAQGAHIYSIGLYDFSFVNCVNTLIGTYGVNIINMSCFIGETSFYNGYCAYIDYVTQNTSCLFVKSAGNNGATTCYVSSPGGALNSVSVGSIDVDKDVSYFSSYVLNNYDFKPDMVAPGGRIYNIPNIDDYHSGTSLSASMVTGISALLMEEFPLLKTKPSLLVSALRASCSYLPSQTQFYDAQCGYGLVNYLNARNYLNSYHYSNFYIPSSIASSSTVSSQIISVGGNNKLEINAQWTIPSSSLANPNGSSYSPIYTKCYLKLFDLDLSTYVASKQINSNSGYLVYTNTTNSTKSYRLDIITSTSKNDNGIESGSYVYNIYEVEHEHHYNYSYSMHSSDKHKAYCECGLYVLRPHAVTNTYTINGHTYGNCIDCGALVDLETTIVIFPGINSNVYLMSANGSYILPNGIYVIVPADLEAYLNGTLEFYYSSDFPISE